MVSFHGCLDVVLVADQAGYPVATVSMSCARYEIRQQYQVATDA